MKFDSTYFFYLSYYLNEKLREEKIISITLYKNECIIDFMKNKLYIYFGENIGGVIVDRGFNICSERKGRVTSIDNFRIYNAKQLYMDRIVQLELYHKDRIKSVKRYLILSFLGKLSLFVIDDERKILYSNDSRFKVGSFYDIKKKLDIYTNLLNGDKYCGTDILDLINNVKEGKRNNGNICIENEVEFKRLIKEKEKEFCSAVYKCENFEIFQAKLKNTVISLQKEKCKSELRKHIQKILRKKKKIVLDLKKHIDVNENEYIEMGNAIIYNKYMVKKGTEEVELPVYNKSGIKSIKIKLKPNLSPEENAKRYFEKAEKLKKKRSNAVKRRKILQKEIKELGKLLEEIPDNLNDLYTEWSKFIKKNREKHKRGFKYFVLKSGARIYIGRNSKENDELTLHFASPNDLFFHVREAPGSHVILRSLGKSHHTADIEAAAAVAAYFSKMRNSKTVPVSYTEIRYVRKPRKAKSGMVSLMKERVIFVSPSLPSDLS